MSTVAKTPTVARDYLELVHRFPLRPIRTAAEHRVAMAIIDELMSLGDEKLSRGQADYLATLGRLVADYERQHVLAELERATPREVLQYLMESRGMTRAELGCVLGSRSAATMILKGQRQMSKAHIRAAAAHFHVSPAVFL